MLLFYNNKNVVLDDGAALRALLRFYVQQKSEKICRNVLIGGEHSAEA